MSNNKQKISRSKARLLVEYPLFGAIASKLELVVNDDIESFKSNGVRLEYNTDYLHGLGEGEIEFVLANGAMHASLSYKSRQNQRSSWLWQLSTDYAVNDMLVQNGMKIPPRAHYDERFSGMYAEEIYALLKEEILRDDLEYEPDSYEDIQNDQASRQNQEPHDALEEELFFEFAKAKLEDAVIGGDLPAGMDRFFDTTSGTGIDWREELKSAIDRFHRDNYALVPPSKKLLYTDIYLPSCKSERFKFAVAIDSSGSVDDDMLNEFLGELGFLMLGVQNYEIELIVCDDRIRSRKIFYSGDILEAELKGGGATDFRPVFELLQSEGDSIGLLLYFTDMDGIFPDEAPNYDVKWVSKKEQDIPFGSLIVLQ